MQGLQPLCFEGPRHLERDQRADAVAKKEKRKIESGRERGGNFGHHARHVIDGRRRSRAPRPGGLMAKTSSHSGRQSGQARNA